MWPDPKRRASLLLPALLTAGLAAGAGCDDGPAVPPPPPVAPRPDPNAPPPRPTTQELTDGPHRRINLTPAPLSADVPQSWKLDQTDLGGGKTVYFLAGPAPAGDVEITLSRQPDVDGDFINALLKTVRAEAAVDPNALVELRDRGAVRVLEQRWIEAPSTTATTGAAAPTVRWGLSYFVPSGLDYRWYKLSFPDLTREQYEANRAFLEKIIFSLKIEGDKGLL